ncbi:hypothetical protein A9Q86_02735 [Flavobacteriales bacterium 33_180_T64]|nr:hypothetical protein A9Q86_02735 [Flavobacteriales bacterium 33_180_T64]
MSCNDSEYSKKIIGEWECSSWIETETSRDKCGNNVYFKFENDMTYHSKIGSDDAKGVYRISDGLLYSTPEGKLEIAVEINTLNADTLTFTMSRSGNEEILTLVKKK